MRSSLGASRGRLIRELLIESLVIGTVAGGVGVLLAMWGADMLVRLAPSEMTFLNLNQVGVDRRVLLFTIGVTLGCSLIFGLLPAVRTARRGMCESLQSGSRQAGSPSQRRLGRSVIVAELALSLALLVAAGLLSRTFVHLTTIQPGFDTANLTAFGIELPAFKYANQEAIGQFYRDLMPRVRSLPGVEAATVAGGLPPGGGGISFDLKIEAEGSGSTIVDPHFILPFSDVEPDYFSTLRIPLLAGRPFADQDRTGAPLVVIVNDAMAARLWQGANPVGRRMRLEPSDPWLTVVGVVGNVYQFRHNTGRDVPAVYYPAAQRGYSRTRTLAVRTSIGAAATLDDVKAQIRAVNPDQPIYRIETATTAYGEFLAEPRFYAQLMGAFAATGLLLAGIGLYGLMAYTTAWRTAEFGVRAALGAAPQDIAKSSCSVRPSGSLPRAWRSDSPERRSPPARCNGCSSASLPAIRSLSWSCRSC